RSCPKLSRTLPRLWIACRHSSVSSVQTVLLRNLRPAPPLALSRSQDSKETTRNSGKRRHPMSEEIFRFICPAHGRCAFWYLPDAQRVCEICYPRNCTPVGA